MTPNDALKEIAQAIEVMPVSGRQATDRLQAILDQGITDKAALSPTATEHARLIELLDTPLPPRPKTETYKLTYFKKETGKYYSEGVVRVGGLFGEVVVHARGLLQLRQLPGLIRGHSGFDVLLEDIKGLPHLITES